MTLAHSPDSDDAFMFWALKEGFVERDGMEFQHVLSDIQTLNQAALEGRYDVTAISLHVYPYVASQYVLLNVGASVGDGYGPTVVALEPCGLEDLGDRTVGVPGSLTTAALILKVAVPGVRTQEMRFDTVIDAVKRRFVHAGVLIHEGQITYEREGLSLVADLGRWWKEATGLPLPLGVLAARRSLGQEAVKTVADAIRDSIRYGLEHRVEAVKFAQDYSRNLGQPDVDRFVSMYVNEFALDLGNTGRDAVSELLKRGSEAGIVPEVAAVDYAGLE